MLLEQAIYKDFDNEAYQEYLRRQKLTNFQKSFLDYLSGLTKSYLHTSEAEEGLQVTAHGLTFTLSPDGQISPMCNGVFSSFAKTYASIHGKSGR